MRYITAFAGFSEAIPLDGFGENHGRFAFVFDSGLVSGVNFFGVMAAAIELSQLFIGIILHHFQKARIGTKEMPPDIFAAYDGVFLIVAIERIFHSFDQETVVVV